MYEYLKGHIAQLTPTYIVLDNNGIGYQLHISLNTFSKLKEGGQVTMYLHEVIREDAHDLFGFAEVREREVFRSLITVSGVGANTARMVLSSLSPDETIAAITAGDVKLLKSVKGIGEKSAQRMIIDLKDKLGKPGDISELLARKDNTARQEALSALVMLGFAKAAVEKVLDKLISEDPSATVEQLVKHSLKRL